MIRRGIDHDCNWSGCAKLQLDADLHEFDECWGGVESKIRMGDIDGAVERRGHVLFMEWKQDIPHPDNSGAQFWLHQALTANSPNHVSFWVVGDPPTMRVYNLRVMRDGEWVGPWQASTLDDLKARFRRWFAEANSAPWPVYKARGAA